jgi:hypothetical protein
MKRYLLSRDNINNNYYLDYGCFDRQRESLGKLGIESLVERLNRILPLHKQILIYAEESWNDEIKKVLSKSFKNTRIKLEFKKDLRSLC